MHHNERNYRTRQTDAKKPSPASKKVTVQDPTSSKRRLAAGALAVAFSLFATSSIAGAATKTTTQTASAGNITASYTYNPNPPFSQHSNLKIIQSGKVVYNQVVSSVWCGKVCWPDFITEGKKVIHVVKLQRNGTPSVVLDLYSGGAHCCSIEQVYTFKLNSTTVHKFEHNFGDPGEQLVQIGQNHSYDLLSADDHFAYEFTDFAASGLPIEILSFSGSTFHNITRSFPNLIAKDAKVWINVFKSRASSHYEDSVGGVAAWAADEDMLGHSAAVSKFLAAQVKAGHLNSALSSINLEGEKFVIALQKFLRLHGYLKR